MFPSQLHGMVAAERHKDFIRQTERDRLADLARTGQLPEYRRVLTFIGNKLFRQGSHWHKHNGNRAISVHPMASHVR